MEMIKYSEILYLLYYTERKAYNADPSSLPSLYRSCLAFPTDPLPLQTLSPNLATLLSSIELPPSPKPPLDPSDDKLLRLSKKLLRRHPQVALGHYCFSIFGDTASMSESLKFLQKGQEIESQPFVYVFMGIAYMTLSRDEEAKSCFERAVQEDSHLGVAWSRLAFYRHMDGDESCLDCIERALSVAPDDVDLIAEKMHYYTWFCDFERAEEYVKGEVARYPKSVPILLSQSMFYSIHNQVKKGREILDEVSKLGSQTTRSKVVSTLNYMKGLELSSALMEAEVVLKRAKADGDSHSMASAYLMMSIVFENQGQMDKAKFCKEKAEKEIPYFNRNTGCSEYFLKDHHRFKNISEGKNLKETEKEIEVEMKKTSLDQQPVSLILQQHRIYFYYGNYVASKTLLISALNEYNSSILWSELSQIHLALGEKDEAKEAIEKAIELDPIPNNYAVKGLIYCTCGEFQEVEKFLKESIKAECVLAYAVQSLLYAFQLKYDEALKSIDKAINKQPCNGLYWKIKSNHLLAMDNLEDSLMCINKACKFSPNHLALLEEKAVVLHRMGKTEEAMNFLKSHETIHPNAICLKQLMLMEQGHFEEAREDIINSINHTGNVLFYLPSIIMLLLQDEFDKASEIIEKLPLNGVTFLIKAQVLLKQNRIAEAEVALAKGENLGCTSIASSYYWIIFATLNMKKSKFKEALQILEEHESKFTSYYLVLCASLKAQIYSSLGMTEKALGIILPLEDSITILEAKAIVYLSGGYFEKANQTLDKYERRMMSSSSYLSLKGYIFLYLKQIDFAQDLFELTLEISPNDVRALTGVSECWIVKGEKEKGLVYLEKAQTLLPNDKSVLMTEAKYYFGTKISLEAIDKLLLLQPTIDAYILKRCILQHINPNDPEILETRRKLFLLQPQSPYEFEMMGSEYMEAGLMLEGLQCLKKANMYYRGGWDNWKTMELKFSDLQIIDQIETYGRASTSYFPNTNVAVVVKILKKNPTPREQQKFKEVINMCSEMRGTHFATLLAYCYNPLVLVTEKIEYNLKQYREFMGNIPFNLSEVAYLFKSIIDAVTKLHRLNTIHCNLHPGNILLTETFQVKLADFENSKNPSSVYNPVPGNELFLPPEGYGSNYTTALDLYSIGVIIIFLLKIDEWLLFPNNTSLDFSIEDQIIITEAIKDCQDAMMITREEASTKIMGCLQKRNYWLNLAQQFPEIYPYLDLCLGLSKRKQFGSAELVSKYEKFEGLNAFIDPSEHEILVEQPKKQNSGISIQKELDEIKNEVMKIKDSLQMEISPGDNVPSFQIPQQYKPIENPPKTSSGTSYTQHPLQPDTPFIPQQDNPPIILPVSNSSPTPIPQPNIDPKYSVANSSPTPIPQPNIDPKYSVTNSEYATSALTSPQFDNPIHKKNSLQTPLSDAHDEPIPDLNNHDVPITSITEQPLPETDSLKITSQECEIKNNTMRIDFDVVLNEENFRSIFAELVDISFKFCSSFRDFLFSCELLITDLTKTTKKKKISVDRLPDIDTPQNTIETPQNALPAFFKSILPKEVFSYMQPKTDQDSDWVVIEDENSISIPEFLTMIKKMLKEKLNEIDKLRFHYISVITRSSTESLSEKLKLDLLRRFCNFCTKLKMNLLWFNGTLSSFMNITDLTDSEIAMYFEEEFAIGSEKCIKTIKKMEKWLFIKGGDLSTTEKTLDSWNEEMENLFSSFVGLNEAKQRIRDVAEELKFSAEQAKQGISHQGNRTLSLVFTGPPGTGKTTFTRALAKILYSIGFLKSEMLIETGPSDLVSQYIGETGLKVKDLFYAAQGSVLLIDEAYSLNDDRTGKQALEELVNCISENQEPMVVVFCGYREQMEALLKQTRKLASLISHVIQFPELTSSQIAEASFLQLFKLDLIIPDSLTFEHMVSFINSNYPLEIQSHNASLCRKVVSCLLSNMNIRVIDKNIKERKKIITLEPDDFQKKQQIVLKDQRLESLLSMLEGNENMKAYLRELAYSRQIENRRKDLYLPVSPNQSPKHILLIGGDGVGKRTAVEMITKFIEVIKYFPNRTKVRVKITHRTDLVGNHVSETPEKTKKVIQEGKEFGVLYIKEVQNLVNSGFKNDYGPEAIIEIMNALESDGDSLLMIFSLTPDSEDEFLESNPGLSRRIGVKFNMYPPTFTELASILQRKCNESKEKKLDHSVSDEFNFLRVVERNISEDQRSAFGGWTIDRLIGEAKKNRRRRLQGKKVTFESGSYLEESDFTCLDVYIPL